jgi:hypothetical protein
MTGKVTAPPVTLTEGLPKEYLRPLVSSPEHILCRQIQNVGSSKAGTGLSQIQGLRKKKKRRTRTKITFLCIWLALLYVCF